MEGSSIEAVLRDCFRDQSAFIAVYLFGSQACGTARSNSDVDLGLLYARPPESTLHAQPFEL
jgi:predicted nucleotidyltransferase